MSQHTPASHPPLSLNLGCCSSPGVGGGESQKTAGQTVPTLMLYTVQRKGMAPASLCLCNDLPHGKMGLQEACHAPHQRGGPRRSAQEGLLDSSSPLAHDVVLHLTYTSMTLRQYEIWTIKEAWKPIQQF